MVQFVEAPTKTFLAAAALAPYLRVKITDATTTPPTVNVAGATDVALGTVERRALAAGDQVTIRLANAQGTRIMIASASETITGGNPVYAAASGKISASGTVVEGRALETVTAANDQIEVMSLANTDLSSSIATTNAVSFKVDADASTPKIALSGQAAGTGDFTTTLKPETTLSANNAIIVPEADGDTLAAVALAQELTNKTMTAQVVKTGLTASGSASNDFSGSTGTFKTSSGTNTLSGDVVVAAAKYLSMGVPAAAESCQTLMVGKTGIADNTATSMITVTVPHAAHSAVLKLTILGAVTAGASTRCATGLVTFTRTAGDVDAVGTAATLDDAAIATVAAGETLTLAYALTSVAGANTGAQTFDVQVTLNTSAGATAACLIKAELLNLSGTGVTMAESA